MRSFDKSKGAHASVFGFPKNVFFLSLVSFLNDIGGETIKKTIPLFLANVLGVQATVIGFVEGIAEATPQLLQPISGAVSDRFQKRKPLVVVGQVMRSAIVFLFWATTWPQILFLRFLDRSGKGLGNAPRDALIAGSSQPGHVGRSFGLTRMFDNGGAVVGLLLASVILYLTKSQRLSQEVFSHIVLLAVIPLFFSVLLLVFLVRDIPAKIRPQRFSLRNGLGEKFYLFLGISFLFTIGNSSDAFLILKAQLVGIPVWQIFLLLAGYSLVSSLSGLPLSSLSDRIGRKKLLVGGWILYAVVYFLFAQSSSTWAIVCLFLLYGLYYGMTEGSAKALVSDIVPDQRKATAFGLYNMVTGVTLFVASLIGGFLWQTYQPAAAFYFGSSMAAAAAVGLFFFL